MSNLILRDSQDSSKLNKPYKQRLETALDNIQATVFYPIKYLGPMLIAAFPATITGLSFYYHIIETVGYTWALTVAILAGLLFEIANLFLAHIASDLFNHKKIWQGIAIAILATITIYQIMQVLGESVLIVGQSLLPVVHITPLITAFVYIANTFAETIKDERQQAKIDYDFETQKRLIELENLRLDSEQKRTMKAEKLRLKHEETLAAIDRKPTGIQPEILDRKNVQNAGNNGKTEILAEINFDRKMNVKIGNKPLSLFSDNDLIDWLNEISNGYKLRKKTANLYVTVFRIFNEVGPPMTVRQLFYALVSKRAISKTENAYDSVSYHLLQMRRNQILPYGFIADNTRWMRKPDTYRSMEDFLRISQDTYRRMLWLDQPDYVEIWCEKDALAGVINEITQKWDVPLMVTRGFPSETFVYEAAQTIKEKGKNAYLYYFGDYDPSGQSIINSTYDKLRGFGASFEFEQVAITKEQVAEWDLPMRPTKKTDSRSKNWQGGSVELDALPARILRELVETSITRHIDENARLENELIEESEKQTLQTVLDNFRLA